MPPILAIVNSCLAQRDAAIVTPVKVLRAVAVPLTYSTIVPIEFTVSAVDAQVKSGGAVEQADTDMTPSAPLETTAQICPVLKLKNSAKYAKVFGL